MREGMSRLQEHLQQICSETSEEAHRREPWREISIRLGGYPLDPGIRENDFCDCSQHAVPVECFAAFSNAYTRLVLRHYTSVWLTKSVNRVVGESKHPPINKVIEDLREFFGFSESGVPKVFQTWLHTALKSRFEILEGKSRSGAFRDRQKLNPLRLLPSQCHSVASCLAQVFRAEFTAQIEGIKKAEIAPADVGEGTGRPRRGRPRDKLVELRRRVIQEIAATGVKGEEYCSALAGRGLETSISWQKNEGCPRSYPEAWRYPKWRKRIQDEKHKNTRSHRIAQRSSSP